MPLPSDSIGGCCWVHEPVVAGDVFLVPSLAYGMQLEPVDRGMFVYNPPPPVQTDPMGEVLDPEPFFPPTERDGDPLRMPVTFPDGSEATLVYPIPLGLERMGVQPDLSYSFRGRYQGPIVFLHNPNASIRRFVDPEGAPMLINSSAGGLELWPARGDDGRSWLRLELLSWTVLVALEEPGTASEVAAALDIRETASGFPVVNVSGEAELAEGFGEAGGAQLSFGDAAADPDRCPARRHDLPLAGRMYARRGQRSVRRVRRELPRRWRCVRQHLRRPRVRGRHHRGAACGGLPPGVTHLTARSMCHA